MFSPIGVACGVYARDPSGRPIGRETPMNRTHIAAGIAAASALALLAPAPAFAAPPIIDHWSDHIEHIEQVEHAPDWCPDVPFDVLYTEDASGTFRFVQHGDGNYYGASSIDGQLLVDECRDRQDVQRRQSRQRQGPARDRQRRRHGHHRGPVHRPDDVLRRRRGPALHGRRPRDGTIVIDTNGTPSDPDGRRVRRLRPRRHARVTSGPPTRDFCADIMEFIG